MTTARRDTVDEEEVCIYHCYSRCVRRAYLFGYDAYTGKCYDHRKDWIRERLKFLSKIFTIDMLEYALMSTHTHSMVRTRPDILQTLSGEEVARRWLKLYPPRDLVNRKAEIRVLAQDQERIAELRKRLGSISWYMKSLNEYIARRANKEDDCKGRFWEGRFKCQRLRDDSAVLGCAVYVALNPVRAKAAETPEASDYTGVQERIRTAPEELWLAPVENTGDREGFLSMSLPEYLTLVDETGREMRDGKRGSIPKHLEPLLVRTGISPGHWLRTVQHFRKWFSGVAGNAETLSATAQELGKAWCKGTQVAKRAFL